MPNLVPRAALPALFLALAACQTGAEAEAPLATGLVPVEDVTLVEGMARPRFQADPSWPKLPDNWVTGQTPGLSVDPEGNIWVIHRSNSVGEAPAGKIAAPFVMRFSPEGDLLTSWGGPSHAPEIDGVNQWPANVHGIFVDADGTVWIGGNGGGDHVVLNFTPEGAYLGQFGRRNATAGNLDETTLGGPADIFRHGDQVLVADGYTNRRILAFDAGDKRFERYWGAYGAEPAGAARQGDFDQSMASAGEAADPQSKTFGNIVHCVEESSNGDIYVCDRRNNRIQLFRRDDSGAILFVKDILIAPESGGTRTASDVAFSPDETYMYVADMVNTRVWVLLRETHQILGSFGSQGHEPGQFSWLHSVVTDKAGNVYTSEVGDGRRAQKFALIGME